MQKITSNNHQSGFTLIELLVVATIIIVLTTIGIVSFRTASQKSKVAKCKGDLQTVRQALVMYRSEHGTYPPALNSFEEMVTNLKDEGYLASSDDFSPPAGASYGRPSYGDRAFTLRASNCDTSDILVSSP